MRAVRLRRKAERYKRRLAGCDAALPAGLRQVVHARRLLRLRHNKAHTVNYAIVVEFALLSCLRLRVMCFF
jgi:hypothetical protein